MEEKGAKAKHQGFGFPDEAWNGLPLEATLGCDGLLADERHEHGVDGEGKKCSSFLRGNLALHCKR